MTPAAIIRDAAADGVTLTLTSAGTIKAAGDSATVAKWLPSIREHKPGLVAVLAANDGEGFAFTPPGDPANDDEALQERVAIMMEGSGWSEAKALEEARWQADKERCWRAFLRNATRILGAPEAKQGALLTRYGLEASRRYGEATGRDMAASLRSWITARAVH